MSGTFDPALLGHLHADQEVAISPGKNRGRPVVIWAVVANGAAFVRSVRGPKGKWYIAAARDGEAMLEVAGRQVAVKLTPVTDAATIEAVSNEFLRKYASSPYAKSIVAADTLPTTLRLDPR